MGTFQQHAAIVMVHGRHDQARDAFEQVRQFAHVLQEERGPVNGVDFNHLLIGPVDTLVNHCQVYTMLPDGSKEGWQISDDADRVRRLFIEVMSTFGEVAEVSWGEYGERVTVKDQWS